MKSIEDYVHLESEYYQNILDKNDVLFKDKFNSDNLSEIDNIVLYATGSSSNAAYSARPFMSQILSMPVYIEEPSISATYGLFPNKHTLYIAISQGGHSYSTINMVEKLEKQKQQVFVLTSDLKSPIATTSKNIISMGIPIEEMTYVSAGYSATILDLILISMEISKQRNQLNDDQYKSYQAQLSKIINSIPSVVSASTNWVQQNINNYLKAKRILFIGYGSAYGVAREGETKITETVRITAFGKELEEYMHGPYLGLHTDDRMLFIEPHGKLEHRAQLLKEFLGNHVENVATVYANNTSTNSADLNLNVESDELLASLFLTIPVHLLSYRLSQEKGYNLEVSTYPEFDKITGSKI